MARQTLILAKSTTDANAYAKLAGLDRFTYRAVRSAIDFHDGTALAIDIGGGSVELIVGTADKVYLTSSEPLGALRMAQMFELDRAATPAMVDQCRAWVRKRLKKEAGKARSAAG